MNMINSSRTYEDFLQYMEALGFADSTLKLVCNEIQWLKKQPLNVFDSYSVACSVRSAATKSSAVRDRNRCWYERFEQFACLGFFYTVPDYSTKMINSGKSYEDFFRSMSDCGYSEAVVRVYRADINWLLKNMHKGFASYKEALELRILSLNSDFTIAETKSRFKILNRFADCGKLSILPWQIDFSEKMIGSEHSYSDFLEYMERNQYSEGSMYGMRTEIRWLIANGDQGFASYAEACQYRLSKITNAVKPKTLKEYRRHFEMLDQYASTGKVFRLQCIKNEVNYDAVMIGSERTYSELLSYLNNEGYSESILGSFKAEINWVLFQAESFQTYEDAYAVRYLSEQKPLSPSSLRSYRWIYSAMSRFAVFGSLHPIVEDIAIGVKMLHSERTYDDLLNYLQDQNYGNSTVCRVKSEVLWVLSHAVGDCCSYSDLYAKRAEGIASNSIKTSIKSAYSVFERFAFFGKTRGIRLSDVRKAQRSSSDADGGNKAVKAGAYHQLKPYFKAIIDQYVETSIQQGVPKTTYDPNKSSCSCFLLYLQQLGYECLDDVSEYDILSYFFDESGELKFGNRTKCHIASVFQSDLGDLLVPAERVLLSLPALRRQRKNIQYLSKEESAAIRNVLSSDENTSNLSLRNKAIGTILYYTGLRSGDVATLKLSEIDWEHDEINLIQNKTGHPLTLPLTAIVGNAIYDYIMQERPKCNTPEVFVAERLSPRSISTRAVRSAVNKIYAAASVRQLPGDRRGTHIFRHNLVTTMAANNVPRAVITSVVGHSDPMSINDYLSADIENLRKCALSIEAFPVREGVFQI